MQLLPHGILTLCCTMVLYLTGIGDDLVGLRYQQKLVIQLFVASAFVTSGLWITNLYGVLGVSDISLYFGIPLSIFIIVFIINAINFIDGIDGLASGLSMIAFLLYGCMFLYLHFWFYCVQAFVAFGMLVPFFHYNVFGSVKKRQKIFMGDVGSLTIAMLLSVFMLKLCYIKREVTQIQDLRFIVMVFSVLIVPVFDTIGVIIYRIYCRCSPFKPDRNHIHHRFLDLGLSHKFAMMLVLLISIFFGVSNVLLAPYVSINFLLIFDIVLWTVMYVVITIKVRKKHFKERAKTCDL